MAELEQQKAQIEARLRKAPPDLPDVNFNVAEGYRRKVTRLADALADSQAEPGGRLGHPARSLAMWC
jgi:hypothetical protein